MLSVVINTKNSAETLKSALESVKWADEIVVVDMHSTDETIKIAKKFTDKIFEYKDVGYVEPARNFAMNKAKGDWILILDSDEEVSPELRKTVELIVHSDGLNIPNAYAISRKNLVFGDWLQLAGWWPDYQLRLFKKGTVEWSDKIHSIPKVKGQAEKLPAEEKLALVHHNYFSVTQFVERLNNYTSKEVLHQNVEQISPSDVVRKFRQELMTRLFRYQGVNGGTREVGISFLQAMYEVLVAMKVWEKTGAKTQSGVESQTVTELTALQQDLGYWIADWKVQRTTGLNKIFWQIRRRLKM